ncbi:rhodanese-like domain-containing protein [Streptomyces flavofungini]|uniref:rhodanese-like domain-containing protein n=1 Tax=Streptomyces flavofungini TaxID=68200 RepID=UPI0025AFD9A6|nr:rhodanese-like domain-containing protein [Streptomyces flavofungini]WJV50375.1 rhodanese-like domain-containing protein [Streptomyces flavofungini]
MPSRTALTAEQARHRLDELVVVDVRTPAEFASGHLPGAHNIPLERLPEALPALDAAAARGELLMVCATGNRSARACARLAEDGVPAATLTDGTTGWTGRGYDVERTRSTARATWAMERQVRLTAGSLILTGLALGLLWPYALWLSAAVAAGLVLAAVTDTCGLASVLARLPHNRPRDTDLHATLVALNR